MTTGHLKTKVQLTYKTEYTSNLRKERTHDFQNKKKHVPINILQTFLYVYNLRTNYLFVPLILFIAWVAK